MVMDRDLDWDGLVNARDLGGLPTTDGGRTRRGAVVRSEALDRLTEAGWAALRGHGIRTIVDLRNDDERGATHPPTDLTTVRVPLDALTSDTFSDEHGDVDGTALWLRRYLEDAPRAAAEVVGAIAGAEPGGVLVHCAGGRDRTGLVAMLLLALAGVLPEEIAADYEHSAERLHDRLVELGHGWQEAAINAVLERHGTTTRDCVLDTLDWLDVQPYLLAGGLEASDIAALRRRILS